MAQSRRGCTNSTERFSTARAELSLKTDPAVSPTAALCRLSAGGPLSRDWGRGLGCDLCSVAALAGVVVWRGHGPVFGFTHTHGQNHGAKAAWQTPKVANTVLEACSSASVGFGASTQRKFPTPDGRFRHWETFCEAGAGDTAVDLYRRSRVEQKPSVVARKP